MRPLQFQKFLHDLETTTLRLVPFAKPDSYRLVKKLHAGNITQKETITLVKRLKKAGYLHGNI